MRHGRAKAARKTLSFFARQGVIPPFSVLADGPFLVQAVVHKIPIIERIEKLLQYSAFSVYVTRSTLQELQVLARHAPEGDKRDAIAQARQWGLDECEIIEEKDIPKETVEETTELGIPGQDIVKLLESHAHSYIVATLDEVLLDVLRNSGQCPLLRLSRGVLLLENPSKAAQNRAQYMETKKYSHSAVHTSERELAKSVKQEMRQAQPQHTSSSSTRVKRKAKGPNPLSCKKKQSTENTESAHKRKRRRKHKNGEK